MASTTIGRYLGTRLEELGLRDFFAIPGDFNMALLDELLKQPGLRMINCCNELNMGYAADGYARARGLAAMVLTFEVGGLSALNAVAGAYAEGLPVIVISGGPNLASLARNRVIHHTRAEPQAGENCVRDVFRSIAAHAVAIREAGTAALAIDEALRIALALSKPVYLEIACDLAATPIAAPNPLDLRPVRHSDPGSLEAALRHATRFLDRAQRPVLVAGGRLRAAGAIPAFQALAGACAYGVACMPDGKGFFPEDDPRFLGIYWAGISSPGCREIVEGSEAALFAGPVFSDYTTMGFTAQVQPERLIDASPGRVVIEGESYHGLELAEFLEGLGPRLRVNPAAVEAYGRVREGATAPLEIELQGALRTRRLFHHLEASLDPGSTLVAETGDTWFNAMELPLPAGCRFEVQMQFGSIGWSVGACLGLMLAEPTRRVVGLIGDGAFQMGAQEVSTMLRYGCSGLLVLMNNGGYAVETMIHEGPYNAIQPWRYADLIEVFRGGGRGWGRVARTEAELVDALAAARSTEGLCLLEAVLDPGDCNRSLRTWGAAVAAYNARPLPFEP